MIGDGDRAQSLRDALLEELEREGELRTLPVRAAMRAVPRHLFCPGYDLELAYGNFPLEIGHGQTISQPAVVAMMTEALSRLCREVYTVERIQSLADTARARLLELGYTNVHVRAADGYDGWREQAPFDRVIVTAAPPEIPRALVDQLASGGILVAPVGGDDDFSQSLVKATKRGGSLDVEDLGGVRFVAMRSGTAQT
jgi:protein-L-isoaspartate(D-aspartate) O-methyltransferase